METVSIIVPVYNVEKYISECIDSILSQTYKYIEIILIDDGSTDDSGYICDEYASKDERIKVIHQLNSGVSSARNAGILMASGQWVFFVDGDDWISEDAIDCLISEGDREDVDLIVGSCIKAYVGREELDTSCDILRGEFNLSERMEDLLSSCVLNISSSPLMFPADMRSGPQLTYPVLKLYKKSILDENHILFDVDLSIGEDKLFNLYYISCCKNKIVFINKRIYYYRMRLSSASNNIENRVKQIIKYEEKVNVFLNDKKLRLPNRCLDYNVTQMYWKLLQNMSANRKDNNRDTMNVRLIFNNTKIRECIKRVAISDASNRNAKFIIGLLKLRLDFILFLVFRLTKKKQVGYYE